jgi:hypothetical protein
MLLVCQFLRICGRSCLQLGLLRTRWHIILACLLFQYVHGIFTQLAYRMHRSGHLHDLGFEVIPVSRSCYLEGSHSLPTAATADAFSLCVRIENTCSRCAGLVVEKKSMVGQVLLAKDGSSQSFELVVPDASYHNGSLKRHTVDALSKFTVLCRRGDLY